MEVPSLRQSTTGLGQRMTELNRSINALSIRSCQIILLYVVAPAQMLRLSNSRYITYGLVWLPLSLSLVMFALGGFSMYGQLGLLRTYSTEMEIVAAELDKNRRRLLDLGLEHDAYLALKAGIWAVPAWAARMQGIANILLFVSFSVLLLYAEYTYLHD